MNFVCFNGKMLPSGEPVFTAQNNSYKWGDGVFETMKVYQGTIILEALHFERLFLSLKILHIESDASVTQEILSQHILDLCKKNNCLDLARVRLAVYRNENNIPGYSIEALPLADDVMKWSEQGLILSVYPFARKSADAFSNLKSANFLPYLMASMYAQQNGFDDALVLNAQNCIADSSRANLFLIKGDKIYTPALHQACINGVMRRFLLESFKKHGILVHQDEITEAEVLNADEVFLTNAIQGIRWVKKFKEKEYGYSKTFLFYTQFVSTIQAPVC